jgi:hypothetical protein
MTDVRIQTHDRKHGGGVTYWVPSTTGDLHVVDVLSNPNMDSLDLLTRDGEFMQVEWFGHNFIVVIDRDSACVHPGLLSGSDAPRYESGHPEGGEFYSAWLDQTRHCNLCGADVPNRDL